MSGVRTYGRLAKRAAVSHELPTGTVVIKARKGVLARALHPAPGILGTTYSVIFEPVQGKGDVNVGWGRFGRVSLAMKRAGLEKAEDTLLAVAAAVDDPDRSIIGLFNRKELALLAALSDGPKTTAQLARLTSEQPGSVLSEAAGLACMFVGNSSSPDARHSLTEIWREIVADFSQDPVFAEMQRNFRQGDGKGE